MADYTILDWIPGYSAIEHGAGWGPFLGGFTPLLDAGNPITLGHFVFATIAMLVIIALGLIARRKYADMDTAILPEGKINVRNLFEAIFDALFNLMVGMMPRDKAIKYFPLVASLALFILVCNLMGLVPGLLPPTQNLNTNIAMALVVFVVYNFAGFREHGFGYLKHFAGPVWWLMPLLFCIELISHVIRPLSLTLRLGGNMTGDHLVLGVFSQIGIQLFHTVFPNYDLPLFLPIPFLFLGLLVSVIQTVIFCVLTSVYIGMAVAHDH